MGMQRSTYYYKEKPRLAKEAEDARIGRRISEIAAEFPRYGYLRITMQLLREGEKVNHKRVLRLMREMELLVKPARKSVRTTDSSHGMKIYPDAYRKLKLTGVNQAWVSDITYVRLQSGSCYLAVVLDAYSRRAVGWSVSKRIDANLVIAALERALEERMPGEGCVHHSDRGSQYASAEYVRLLKSRGFTISMSRKGNPYDNAKAESFIKTLKTEEVYLSEYRNIVNAAACIGAFIEKVYNEKRLHSALGYVPPAEFELSLKRTKCTTSISESKCPA